MESDDGSQSHVYGEWPEPGTDDDGKIKLAEQVGIHESDGTAGFCACS